MRDLKKVWANIAGADIFALRRLILELYDIAEKLQEDRDRMHKALTDIQNGTEDWDIRDSIAALLTKA